MPIETFKAKSHSVPGSLVVENSVRNFQVVIDEPPSLGGTDEGMNPVEMLLCSLGSCQCIVARAFAKAKHIDLEDIWVEIEGDLDTDGFLKGKPGVRPGFTQVRFDMHIKSSSPKEKIDEFVEFIKARCPVGDTLIQGTQVVPGSIFVNN